jgi:proline-specific peptidase
VTETFATDDGRTLSYERRGNGPLLVCHPGGPGFSNAYLVDLGGLDASFTLVLLNPRGTAASTAPADATAYTPADYVADVEELRLHLGVEQLDLLGHSHGGVVAGAYAAAHPDRLQRLILANSLARILPEAMEAEMLTHADEPWYENARVALEREDAGDYADDEELSDLVRSFMPFYFAHFDATAQRYLEAAMQDRPNPDPLRIFNADISTWDMRPELHGITAPTLVITGDRDFITGPACADDISSSIAGSTRVIVDDCGHFTFVEQPERWREEITSFLA